MEARRGRRWQGGWVAEEGKRERGRRGRGGGVCLFQAGAGIREYDVAGVQTWALPIYAVGEGMGTL